MNKRKRNKRSNTGMIARIKAALEWNMWIKSGAKPLKKYNIKFDY